MTTRRRFLAGAAAAAVFPVLPKADGVALATAPHPGWDYERAIFTHEYAGASFSITQQAIEEGTVGAEHMAAIAQACRETVERHAARTMESMWLTVNEPTGTKTNILNEAFNP